MPWYAPRPLTQYLKDLPSSSREHAKSLLLVRHRIQTLHCPQCWTFINSSKLLSKLQSSSSSSVGLPTCLCELYSSSKRLLEGYLAFHPLPTTIPRLQKPHKVRWKINVVLYTHPNAYGNTEFDGRLLIHALQPIATCIKGLETHEQILAKLLQKKPNVEHVCIVPTETRIHNVKIKGQIMVREENPIRHASDFTRKWWHKLAHIARANSSQPNMAKLNLYVMQAPKSDSQEMIDALPAHVHRIRIGPRKLIGGNWYLDRYLRQPTPAESVGHFLNLLHLNGHEIFDRYHEGHVPFTAELQADALNGIFPLVQSIIDQGELVADHPTPRYPAE